MKKHIDYKTLLQVFLIASILTLSPLLMAFTYYPLGQVPVPPSWILNLLKEIGQWVLQNLPIVVEITGKMFNFVFHQCGAGQIIPDQNSSLNAVYTGCIKCIKDGVSYETSNIVMIRESINVPWDMAPSQNICK